MVPQLSIFKPNFLNQRGLWFDKFLYSITPFSQIKYLLIKYLFIGMPVYCNIVSENVVCDEGLKMYSAKLMVVFLLKFTLIQFLIRA